MRQLIGELRCAAEATVMLEIRDALPTDCASMLTIYNEVLRTSTAIFSDQPRSEEQQRYWLEDRVNNDLPVLVASDASGIVGSASYGPFRAWPGYRYTVENSIYFAANARQRGYGTLLLSALVQRATQADLHTMVAGIDGENTSSMRLHEKLGFARVAHLRQVGRKFDRWLDLTFYQRLLQSGVDK